jgi:NADPH:quinone reductase-like Zn-dependent oxidoreductase
MATMKAVRIHNYGGSDVLVYEEVPVPEPGSGELLVRVRAASVTPMDWKMREGYVRQWVDVPMPHILGRALAGDVVAIGPDVTGFAVGDAVCGTVNLMKGTHAEYAAVPAAEVMVKPTEMDYESAAAVSFSALAAWQALIEAGSVAEGQTVLIHAAAGAVGSLAVQIAKAHGARVIGTASAANAEFVRALGADEVIDYTTTRFEDVVHDIDLVLDLIGGDTQDRSWQVLKPGGILVSLVSMTPEAQEAAAAQGARAAMVATRPDMAQLQQIADLMTAGRVRSAIGTVRPLAEAREVQELSQTGHARGQLVLRVWEGEA